MAALPQDVSEEWPGAAAVAHCAGAAVAPDGPRHCQQGSKELRVRNVPAVCLSVRVSVCGAYVAALRHVRQLHLTVLPIGSSV